MLLHAFKSLLLLSLTLGGAVYFSGRDGAVAEPVVATVWRMPDGSLHSTWWRAGNTAAEQEWRAQNPDAVFVDAFEHEEFLDVERSPHPEIFSVWRD